MPTTRRPIMRRRVARLAASGAVEAALLDFLDRGDFLAVQAALDAEGVPGEQAAALLDEDNLGALWTANRGRVRAAAAPRGWPAYGEAFEPGAPTPPAVPWPNDPRLVFLLEPAARREAVRAIGEGLAAFLEDLRPLRSTRPAAEADVPDVPKPMRAWARAIGERAGLDADAVLARALALGRAEAGGRR